MLFKRLEWQDYALIGMILLFMIIDYSLISQLKQLPSPLYGGDYYNHLGTMQHIFQGGSVFENAQLLGESPQWVPWLYHVLVVGFAKLFGFQTLTLWKAVLYFSLVLIPLSAILCYLAAFFITRNKTVSLILPALHLANTPILKYTPFAWHVITPLFLISLWLLFKKPCLKTGLFTGISYGLVALSNVQAFFSNSVVFGILLFYVLILQHVKFNHGKLGLNIKKMFEEFRKKNYVFLLAFLIGLVIAQLYWFRPMFVYKARTLNDIQNYGYYDYTSIGNCLKYFLKMDVLTTFLNIPALFKGQIYQFLLSLLFLASVAALFLSKTKARGVESNALTFLKLLVIAGFIAAIHYFFTMPILGTHFGPHQTRAFLTSFALPLTLIYMLSKIKLSKTLKHVLIVAVFLLIFSHSLIHVVNVRNNKWFKTGKQDLPQEIMQLASWVLQNTKLDDVFLTDNEDSFMLNALTGRKVLTYRRTHASPYVDMNQRMTDAAIILYGSNNSLRKQLIKKYRVKYLLWTAQWFRNEYYFDDKGNVVGFFDPLMIEDKPKYRKQLDNANVTYKSLVYWLDPAVRGPEIPKRNVLIPIPFFNQTNPWSPNFTNMLNLQFNTPFVKIYKINITNT
ncbi:hypothetical protein J7L02_04115 [Candidatus Woesearchaeota archaeon]|nr:hypothetical protein [Candidatus Woesearchaeota archaeon]